MGLFLALVVAGCDRPGATNRDTNTTNPQKSDGTQGQTTPNTGTPPNTGGMNKSGG